MFSFSATNVERISGLGEDSLFPQELPLEVTSLGVTAREDHRSLERMRCGAMCKV